MIVRQYIDKNNAPCLARLEDMRIPIAPQPQRMVGLCQQTVIKCQNGARPIVISGRACTIQRVHSALSGFRISDVRSRFSEAKCRI